MTRRGLCLDLDGTIIDSCQYGLRKLESIVRARDLPYDPEIEKKILSLWVGPPEKIISEVWPGSDTKDIVKEWGKDDKPISLVPGGFEALINLFCFFYLSILTSRGRESTNFHIQAYRHLFRFVITSGDTEFHKPDPRSMHPVFKNYEMLDVQQENIIFVGDNIDADWKLAQSLEMEFYAVTSGVNSRDEFIAAGVSPDHVLNTIADLPKILIK